MGSRRATVLAVNREAGILAWLKSCLEAEGFRVFAARDGPTGLELAWRERPALILLDLMPPPPAGCSDSDADGAEMDGFGFLRRLRRENKVGVIVLSRRDDDAIKIATLDSGADDYLTWPCHRLELLVRMHAVLRRLGGGGRAWQDLAGDGEAFQNPKRDAGESGKPG